MEEKQLFLFGFPRKGTKDNPRHKVVLPLDILILLSAIIIILLAFTFSLGVERGRKTAFSDFRLPKKRLENEMNLRADLQPGKAQDRQKNTTQFQNSVNVKEAIAPEPLTAETPTIAEPTTETMVPVPAPIPVKIKKEKYRIQVASFYKKSTAYREAKELEKKGHSVSIIKKGKYAVVFVDALNGEKEAKNSLKLLKKKYKDCILRRL